MQTDLQREVGLTYDYIDTVKKNTNKNMNALSDLQKENRQLLQTIKYVKDLIDEKNPANSRNQELQNFENSSMRSGGNTASHAGSLINEANRRDIGAALTSLRHGGEGSIPSSLAQVNINQDNIPYRKWEHLSPKRYKQLSQML